MERPNTVAGLMVKRAEIAGQIKFLRAQLQKAVCDLDHCDAAIRLFDPDADIRAVKPYPTKHRAKKGQVAELIYEMLRQAQGRPITSLQIVMVQIKRRRLSADEATVVLMRKRVGASLTKLKGQGVIRSVPLDGPHKGWVFADQ